MEFGVIEPYNRKCSYLKLTHPSIQVKSLARSYVASKGMELKGKCENRLYAKWGI